MSRVSPLRRAARDDDIRAQAEALAGSGSTAAALALVTAAAEDLEREAPHEAAVLLADASGYAYLPQGPARSLELAQRAATLVADAEGDVALIVHARLGDALQWNGRYADARREWLRAATASTSTEPQLLCARADALLRAGELTTARESAYMAAVRAREASDRVALRDALVYQATTEIHLGLLREAHRSSRELEAAAGPAMSGDRVEALSFLAWVEALLGDENAFQARIAAIDAIAVELGFTVSGRMAAGLLAVSRGRYDDAVSDLEGKLSWSSPLAAMLSIRPFLDALVEACARSGRHRRAKELVDEVFEPAIATAQPRYVAIAYRMRALTTGDLSGFGPALEQHLAWGNRFEEARTRLLYGESLRRAKRRAEAREQLCGGDRFVRGGWREAVGAPRPRRTSRRRREASADGVRRGADGAGATDRSPRR